MVSGFPAGWQTPVTLLRGGGRDREGNPKAEERSDTPPVLVGWRSTSDPVDRSEATEDYAVLYDDSFEIAWTPTDRVEIPDGPWPSGTWQVDGRPKPWPLGWEVPLRRAS
jgi:hypothetical protein